MLILRQSLEGDAEAYSAASFHFSSMRTLKRASGFCDEICTLGVTGLCPLGGTRALVVVQAFSDSVPETIGFQLGLETATLAISSFVSFHFRSDQSEAQYAH
jgi:hypothetical protein